jgi:hypothetical protein
MDRITQYVALPRIICPNSGVPGNITVLSLVHYIQCVHTHIHTYKCVKEVSMYVRISSYRILVSVQLLNNRPSCMQCNCNGHCCKLQNGPYTLHRIRTTVSLDNRSSRGQNSTPTFDHRTKYTVNFSQPA